MLSTGRTSRHPGRRGRSRPTVRIIRSTNSSFSSTGQVR